MKLIFKIAALLLFIVFFGFALKNTQETTLHFFLNYQIHGPLILLVLGFFVAGFVFGILGMASILLRQRRELARHRKTADSLLHKEAAGQTLPVSVPAHAVGPDGLAAK